MHLVADLKKPVDNLLSPRATASQPHVLRFGPPQVVAQLVPWLLAHQQPAYLPYITVVFILGLGNIRDANRVPFVQEDVGNCVLIFLSPVQSLFFRPVAHSGIVARSITFHVERLNVTQRVFLKRLNRQTRCFSKKLRNLEAAFAMFAAYDNYRWQARKPGKCGAKRGTAAMMAGLAGHVWSFDELFERVLT